MKLVQLMNKYIFLLSTFSCCFCYSLSSFFIVVVHGFSKLTVLQSKNRYNDVSTFNCCFFIVVVAFLLLWILLHETYSIHKQVTLFIKFLLVVVSIADKELRNWFYLDVWKKNLLFIGILNDIFDTFIEE